MPKKSARRAPGMIFIEDKSTSLEVAARKKIIEETQRLKDDSYVLLQDFVFFFFKDDRKHQLLSNISLTHSLTH